jgi:hypothetical protein
MPRAIKKVRNAVFNQLAYLRAMESMGGVERNGTGEDLTWPLKIAKNPNFGWRGYTQATPLNARDGHQLASETWAEGTGAVVISVKEADLNSGPERFINYVGEEMKDGEETLRDMVNTGLLTGSGTWPAPYGITNLVTESNATFHGIAQATYSWWRNQRSASACSTTDAYGPICIYEIQQMAALAARGQRGNPFRLAITDDATFANMMYYLPQLGSTIRNVIETGNQGAAKLTPDMKTQQPKVYLHNAQVIFDHAATSDQMIFCDPGENIKVIFAKNNYFRTTSTQMAEDNFSYRVLMGIVLAQVNFNPYTTGVHYNFNA